MASFLNLQNLFAPGMKFGYELAKKYDFLRPMVGGMFGGKQSTSTPSVSSIGRSPIQMGNPYAMGDMPSRMSAGLASALRKYGGRDG